MIKDDEQLTLAKGIVTFLEEKKAEDVILIDLRKANPYFCYFLIASANSNMQLKSLIRELMKSFAHKLPEKHTLRPEDLDSGWVILDFIDVVVHIFLEEKRSYYNLERLWGDALKIESGVSMK